ncbi:hypothetical protein CTRI78_v001225 [Colletotrichum trifolii]|uniref:Uncharacterized protein n=1 Tax=Colletotrichum trifolii TaxID=5466 RepID=A0A4R8RTD7_COLTR|nr:hypothetical protein CTRI78_v001225 [Colletotrichum trifolii]
MYASATKRNRPPPTPKPINVNPIKASCNSQTSRRASVAPAEPTPPTAQTATYSAFPVSPMSTTETPREGSFVPAPPANTPVTGSAGDQSRRSIGELVSEPTKWSPRSPLSGSMRLRGGLGSPLFEEDEDDDWGYDDDQPHVNFSKEHESSCRYIWVTGVLALLILLACLFGRQTCFVNEMMPN